MAKLPVGRTCIQVIFLCLLGGLTATVQAEPALLAGTYRCSAYNVSGGAGSCRNLQPLELGVDGWYKFSSTRGRWSTQDGKLLLSESRLWGSGKIQGSNSVRFEYDYRGWHHTVTWVCEACTLTDLSSGNTVKGTYPAVSLTLEFGQSVGNVSNYTIVPAETAHAYAHNAPLPRGAVQGVAWDTTSTAVTLATNRNNMLMGGQRYVVFLSWPRETRAVAILDLPPTDTDYTDRLEATLDSEAVLARLNRGSVGPVSINKPRAAPSPDSVNELMGSRPATPDGSLSSPNPGRNAGLQDFVNADKGAPDAYPSGSVPASSNPADRRASPGGQAVALPKCNPQIPHYAQPGSVE